MLRSLLDAFGSKPVAKSSSHESDVALAALMVRVAKSDGQYDAGEKQKIEDLIAHRFDMTQDRAQVCREEAEMVEADATDAVRFTRVLKDHVPLEERMSLLEALWQIALSDGARDAEEDSELRLMARLLGLSDRENAEARHRAQA